MNNKPILAKFDDGTLYLSVHQFVSDNSTNK